MNRRITTLLMALSLMLGLTSWVAFTGKAAGESTDSGQPIGTPLGGRAIASPASLSMADKPINQYTYLATHNAVASHAYGYDLQNSQRYDVTTQLSGGARMLEIDIVYDTPGDNPAGVYVCHCGEAPHSNSTIELARAKDKDLKSKVPLPAGRMAATNTSGFQLSCN